MDRLESFPLWHWLVLCVKRYSTLSSMSCSSVCVCFLSIGIVFVLCQESFNWDVVRLTIVYVFVYCVCAERIQNIPSLKRWPSGERDMYNFFSASSSCFTRQKFECLSPIISHLLGYLNWYRWEYRKISTPHSNYKITAAQIFAIWLCSGGGGGGSCWCCCCCYVALVYYNYTSVLVYHKSSSLTSNLLYVIIHFGVVCWMLHR